jgi:uncharacterized protein
MSLLEVPRVVFDTNVILSAVLFRGSRLAWLRSHWMEKRCVPLISRATALELTRVLSYPRFHLAQEERLRLHGLYVPYCETVEITDSCLLICRDAKDQMLLDLAQTGNADGLVTGDEDLLILAPQTKFRIESPESYRQRIAGSR